MESTAVSSGPTAAGDVDRSAFEWFLKKRRAPDWLTDVHRNAFARFVERGYPSRRDEDWKYTSVEPLREIAFGPAPAPDPAAMIPWVESHGVAGTIRVVTVNGRLQEGLSDPLPAGLSVRSFDAAIAAGDPRVKRLLEAARPPEDTFTALNAAFLADGVVLEIAPGAVLPAPVELLNLATTATKAFSATFRVFVFAGPRSQSTLIEHYAASRDDDTYLNNVVLDAEVGDGAFLDHVKLEDEGRAAMHLATSRVTVGEDGLYSSNVISFGGRLVRNHTHVVLAAEGAHCDLYGLYRLAGDQHVDNRTTIDHAVAHTTSREHYKGVLDDRSTGVFCGRILVRQDAQKIASEQQNNNLLLSDQARANSTPQLEIYADDVQCRHGSTIGQLDEDGLFYLRTRGIDAAAARALLAFAFANEIIDRIGFEPLRERLTGRLTAGSAAHVGGPDS